MMQRAMAASRHLDQGAIPAEAASEVRSLGLHALRKLAVQKYIAATGHDAGARTGHFSTGSSCCPGPGLGPGLGPGPGCGCGCGCGCASGCGRSSLCRFG